jgi:hypothetical protein
VLVHEGRLEEPIGVDLPLPDCGERIEVRGLALLKQSLTFVLSLCERERRLRVTLIIAYQAFRVDSRD